MPAEITLAVHARLPFPDVCQDRRIAQLSMSWSEVHMPSNSIYAKCSAACIQGAENWRKMFIFSHVIGLCQCAH